MASTVVDLPSLRRGHPEASPSELFDKACELVKSPMRWTSANWTVQCDWLDHFANAPTSRLTH